MPGAGLYNVQKGTTTLGWFDTISGALSQLFVDQGTATFTATQTIRVYNGTYAEPVLVNPSLVATATYRLVLEAATGNKPVIDGGLTRNRCIDALDSYITIDGFECKNNNASTGDFGIVILGAGCIVKNCTIYNIKGVGVSIYGPSPDSSAFNNTVYNVTGIGINGGGNNCQFYNNYVYSCTGGCIQVTQTGTNQSIYNNIVDGMSSLGGQPLSSVAVGSKIYGNLVMNGQYSIVIYGADIQVYNNIIIGATGLAALDVYNTSGTLIYNNTIYITSGPAVLLEQAGTINVTIKNNIIYNLSSGTNGYGIKINADANKVGFVSDYNLIYAPNGVVGVWGTTGNQTTLANWKSATSGDANSVSADPKFVAGSNVREDAYKLDKFSPAKRTGTDLSAVLTTDMLGTPREIPWSMGALITNREIV